MVWYSASAGQTVNELGSDSEKGLSDAQARKLIEKHGENKLESGKKPSLIKRFFCTVCGFQRDDSACCVRDIFPDGNY